MKKLCLQYTTHSRAADSQRRLRVALQCVRDMDTLAAMLLDISPRQACQAAIFNFQTFFHNLGRFLKRLLKGELTPYQTLC